jgi:parvulin-like peptidyl-prolyl isomerase
MYKIFFALLLAGSLYAQMIDGVAVVVKGEAITLIDIKNEMALSHSNAKSATDMLIRKKLEKQESKERDISVTDGEVYDNIKQTAANNNMDVSQFYDAVRESNGLSSSQLKAKIKQRLMSQKLYSAIAYTLMIEPTETQIKDYYELNQDKFSHPKSFVVDIYQSKDQSRLAEKVQNPMFYSPDISTEQQVLEYQKIAPQLASLLEHTPLNSFTQIVPNGQSGFMSFYIKEIVASKTNSFESNKDEIKNMIMSEKREQVLSDYFARLRNSADIKIIRMPD